MHLYAYLYVAVSTRLAELRRDSERGDSPVPTAVIIFGLVATLTGDTTPAGEHHNYRETVSIWFRSLLVFQPDIAAMAAATWQFKVHILIGLALFALIPFSRLVHAFTVPLHYLFRPYVVYRSRDSVPAAASRGRVRGWDPVGTPDRDRDPR